MARLPIWFGNAFSGLGIATRHARILATGDIPGFQQAAAGSRRGSHAGGTFDAEVTSDEAIRVLHAGAITALPVDARQTSGTSCLGALETMIPHDALGADALFRISNAGDSLRRATAQRIRFSRGRYASGETAVRLSNTPRTQAVVFFRNSAPLAWRNAGLPGAGELVQAKVRPLADSAPIAPIVTGTKVVVIADFALRGLVAPSAETSKTIGLFHAFPVVTGICVGRGTRVGRRSSQLATMGLLVADPELAAPVLWYRVQAVSVRNTRLGTDTVLTVSILSTDATRCSVRCRNRTTLVLAGGRIPHNTPWCAGLTAFAGSSTTFVVITNPDAQVRDCVGIPVIAGHPGSR